MDKSKEVLTSIKLINDKLNFIGKVDNNEPIFIDYIPPLGDNLGYTSLELFLLSLTSCLGSSVLTILRRMKKKISDLNINAFGQRNEEHPTCFKEITINMKLKSNDVSKEEISNVIKLSEDSYCPVISMLNSSVKISIYFEIEK